MCACYGYPDLLHYGLTKQISYISLSTLILNDFGVIWLLYLVKTICFRIQYGGWVGIKNLLCLPSIYKYLLDWSVNNYTLDSPSQPQPNNRYLARLVKSRKWFYLLSNWRIQFFFCLWTNNPWFTHIVIGILQNKY